MRDPAYIAIDTNGYITLYWGDGTEDEKVTILRGPRAVDQRQIAQVVEEMTIWAEDNGYYVIVPAYDFEVPEPVEIEPEAEDIERFDYNDVDDLLDDLNAASDYEDEEDDPF